MKDLWEKNIQLVPTWVFSVDAAEGIYLSFMVTAYIGNVNK
jgi:hypothetical protein